MKKKNKSDTSDLEMQVASMLVCICFLRVLRRVLEGIACKKDAWHNWFNRDEAEERFALSWQLPREYSHYACIL